MKFVHWRARACEFLQSDAFVRSAFEHIVRIRLRRICCDLLDVSTSLHWSVFRIMLIRSSNSETWSDWLELNSNIWAFVMTAKRMYVLLSACVMLLHTKHLVRAAGTGCRLKGEMNALDLHPTVTGHGEILSSKDKRGRVKVRKTLEISRRPFSLNIKGDDRTSP